MKKVLKVLSLSLILALSTTVIVHIAEAASVRVPNDTWEWCRCSEVRVPFVNDGVGGGTVWLKLRPEKGNATVIAEAKPVQSGRDEVTAKIPCDLAPGWYRLVATYKTASGDSGEIASTGRIHIVQCDAQTN